MQVPFWKWLQSTVFHVPASTRLATLRHQSDWKRGSLTNITSLAYGCIWHMDTIMQQLDKLFNWTIMKSRLYKYHSKLFHWHWHIRIKKWTRLSRPIIFFWSILFKHFSWQFCLEKKSPKTVHVSLAPGFPNENPPGICIVNHRT